MNDGSTESPRIGDAGTSYLDSGDVELLPPAIEIAKLAALCFGRSKDGSATGAIKCAMELYYNAHRFRKRCATFEELLDWLQEGEPRHQFNPWPERYGNGKKLMFHKRKKTDSVRDFLKRKGVKFTKGRNIFENLKKFIYSEHLREVAKQFGWEENCEISSKDQDKALEASANWYRMQSDWWEKEVWQSGLEACRKPKRGDQECYALDEKLLLAFADWRRKIRQTGGDKSRRTWAKRNIHPGP